MFQSDERIGITSYAVFARNYWTLQMHCHVLDRKEKCHFIRVVSFEIKDCKRLCHIFKADCGIHLCHLQSYSPHRLKIHINT
jgi:hypothetical protein